MGSDPVRDLEYNPIRIPDPRVKPNADLGSGSATLPESTSGIVNQEEQSAGSGFRPKTEVTTLGIESKPRPGAKLNKSRIRIRRLDEQ